ncbi:hypothetical protein [Terrihabitans rhizophilus]|uniref:Uncharacterized protein n=1 Tax=Terrihabitans rhizophilus TaxID=3092662 RepID=A0ABU4RRB3_9HYPH|nr:hypothetical protein [Terrihabitans sp. PJ23]MDX6807381.1 hypothetical protein [Terrihabitans sp. PJ23]
MADPKNPRPDNKTEARRSMKPKPGVIDLQATEVTDPSPAPEPTQSPDAEVEAAMPGSTEETRPEAAPETPDEHLEVAIPGIDTPPSESPPPPKPPAGEQVSAGVTEAAALGAASNRQPGETANTGTSAAAANPAVSDAEPRSSLGALVGAGVAGGAITLVVFFLLLSADLIPLSGAGDPALGNRVAAVEREVTTLAERPAAQETPAAGATANVQALQAEIQDLRGQIEGLRNAAPVAGGAPAPQPEIEELSRRVADLTTRVENQPQQAAQPAVPGPELAQLTTRLDELAQRVEAPRQPDPAVGQAVEQASAASRRADEAAQAAQQTAQRLDEVAQQAQQAAQRADEVGQQVQENGQRAGEAVQQVATAVQQAEQAGAAAAKATEESGRAYAEANRAATLAALGSLESAIMRGAPYAGALANARSQIPDAVAATLQANADKGLPTLDIVAARLDEALNKAPRPEIQSQGLLDRFAEGAKGLVRVRPAEDSVQEMQGNDVWAVRSRIQSRLQRRAFADALAEWENLDPAAKEATKREADDLRSRLAVDQALDAVRADALKAAEAGQ